MKTLEAPSLEAWRRWLEKHHATASEIWLVFHRRATGRPSIPYEDAVNEALCWGWIDSLIKRLDDTRYARKFTPRKPDSRWSALNQKRYAQLLAQGRLMPPGLARAPAAGSGYPPRRPAAGPPAYILDAFRKNRAAWKYFETLAPSYRRLYIGWIDSAKRDETRTKRLREAVERLAAGRKLGLK